MPMPTKWRPKETKRKNQNGEVKSNAQSTMQSYELLMECLHFGGENEKQATNNEEVKTKTL